MSAVLERDDCLPFAVVFNREGDAVLRWNDGLAVHLWLVGRPN